MRTFLVAYVGLMMCAHGTGCGKGPAGVTQEMPASGAGATSVLASNAPPTAGTATTAAAAVSGTPSLARPMSAGQDAGAQAQPAMQLPEVAPKSGAAGASAALAGGGTGAPLSTAGASIGGAGAAAPSAPPAGCPTTPLEAGDHMYTLKSANGMTYTYYLFIPKSVDPKQRSPVIFKWHAYTSSPEEFRRLEKVDAVAEAAKTIMVYPKSPDGAWDVGSCCDFAGVKRDEEVFARELYKEVMSKVCADEHRIYTTGLSNGAMLSQMLACKMSDVFAAAATVVGTLTIPQSQCAPKRPIPIFMINGTSDPLVGYNTPGLAGGLAVPADYKFWADKNKCSGEPEMTLQKGKATCKTYKSCSAEVFYCVAEGMGHCMPGMVEESPTNCLTRGTPLGPPNDDIDGVQMASDFLLRFTLP